MRESKVDYKFLEPLGITMERYLSLEDLDGEEWKPLPGYEEYYMVSTLGRIKVLDRIIIERRKKLIKEHILKPKTNGYKYWTVGICIKGKIVYKYVHRLVALTFLENKYNKPEVDHLNTNTNDNRLLNLSWATHMENQYNPITRFNRLLRDNNTIPIVQLSVIGDYVAEWSSISEASYFTGIPNNLISANIVKPERYYSAGGYIFMKKEDYKSGLFKLPVLKSSSKVIQSGIPSEQTVVLYLNNVLVNVFPSNTSAAVVFGVSPSTIKTMCKNSIAGKYKLNDIQFKFFKDISEDEQMKVRRMLLYKRKLAD